MQKLTLTSIQAPNQDRIAASLASYLSRKLGISCEFVHDPPWQERERMLDTGQVDIGWMCGLPYIQKVNRPVAQIELLAAPVMRAARYQARPIYFSDVVVRSESTYNSFGDLRGSRWAYNEPNSHSGYNLTRYMLSLLREFSGYFGSVIQAGSHQSALQMLLAGQIDASAIDSTVLEIELESRPEISNQIRIIASWGPSPIPPWVIQSSLPMDIKSMLQTTLLSMDADTDGQQLLAQLGMARFARVHNNDYDPIREMFRIAQAVQL